MANREDERLDISALLPEAVDVRLVDNPKARRAAAFRLASTDLIFARDCLGELNGHGPVQRDATSTVQQALWRSAVFAWNRAFAGGGLQLNVRDVYGSEPDAQAAAEYYRDLRNRHLAHQQSPYAQASIVIGINAEGAEQPISVRALVFSSNVLDDLHITQLAQLVEVALRYIETKFDGLMKIIEDEVAAMPRELLYALPQPTYRAPARDDLRRG